ncbi:MAG TPA: rhomboid family intramembrane serine protease [Rhizomicrobium sp.]|jgi:membrane associated rhomboid family serine protease
MDATTPRHELPEEHGREPFLRLPWPVTVLVAILLAVYAAQSFVPQALNDSIILDYGFAPARYSAAWLAANHVDPGSLLERALPFVTYMFLHGSWMHVIVNTLWLTAFGPVVVRRFGAARFLLFFLLCGVAGAFAQLALAWASPDPAVGASAAIAGLMAVAFRLIGREGNEYVPPQPMAPIFSQRIMLWSFAWVAINLVVGLTPFGALGVGQVAWQAHLGGYAAGLLLAGLFDPVNRLKAEAL